MMSTRRGRRAEVWIFGVPSVVFLVLPLLCWLVAFATQSLTGIRSDAMFYLFCAFLIWVQVPGMLFRQPLFDPFELGYSPHGILGWIVVLLFYSVISLAISLTIRYVVRRARRQSI